MPQQTQKAALPSTLKPRHLQPVPNPEHPATLQPRLIDAFSLRITTSPTNLLFARAFAMTRASRHRTCTGRLEMDPRNKTEQTKARRTDKLTDFKFARSKQPVKHANHDHANNSDLNTLHPTFKACPRAACVSALPYANRKNGRSHSCVEKL